MVSKSVDSLRSWNWWSGDDWTTGGVQGAEEVVAGEATCIKGPFSLRLLLLPPLLLLLLLFVIVYPGLYSFFLFEVGEI